MATQTISYAVPIPNDQGKIDTLAIPPDSQITNLIDIGMLNKIRIPNYVSGQTDDDNIEFIYRFILFRIMIYCDEMHDFGKALGFAFSELKAILCFDDIKWYMKELSVPLDIEKILDLFRDNLLKTYNISSEEQEKLNYKELIQKIYKIDPKTNKNPFLNLFIIFESYLFKKSQLSNSINSRGRKNELEYITDNYDHIAKEISNIALKLFGLEKSSIIDNLYGCALMGTSFKNIMTTIQLFTYGSNINIKSFSLTIDQEGSTKNVINLYEDIIQEKVKKECNNDTRMQFLAKKAQEDGVTLFQTNATLMDPGEGAFEGVRKYLQFNQLIQLPPLNQYIQISFFGVPIIIYKYYDLNSLELRRIFSNIALKQDQETIINKKDYSVQKRVAEIKSDFKKSWSSFYKTFGDLNQVITFANINSYYMSLGEVDSVCRLFMTGDISCGHLSALFSKNVLTENNGKLGDGLVIYLTAQEKQNTINLLTNDETKLKLLAYISSTLPYEEAVSPINEDVIGANILLELRKNSQENSRVPQYMEMAFGKTKKLKQKRKNKTEKEKYKISKKIKEKAKKLKIKLTKKNSKGKRINKTEKEILKEIKQKNK